jgi:hypothetical protein
VCGNFKHLISSFSLFSSIKNLNIQSLFSSQTLVVSTAGTKLARWRNFLLITTINEISIMTHTTPPITTPKLTLSLTVKASASAVVVLSFNAVLTEGMVVQTEVILRQAKHADAPAVEKKPGAHSFLTPPIQKLPIGQSTQSPTDFEKAAEVLPLAQAVGTLELTGQKYPSGQGVGSATVEIVRGPEL